MGTRRAATRTMRARAAHPTLCRRVFSMNQKRKAQGKPSRTPEAKAARNLKRKERKRQLEAHYAQAPQAGVPEKPSSVEGGRLSHHHPARSTEHSQHASQDLSRAGSCAQN